MDSTPVFLSDNLCVQISALSFQCTTVMWECSYCVYYCHFSLWQGSSSINCCLRKSKSFLKLSFLLFLKETFYPCMYSSRVQGFWDSGCVFIILFVFVCLIWDGSRVSGVAVMRKKKQGTSRGRNSLITVWKMSS